MVGTVAPTRVFSLVCIVILFSISIHVVEAQSETCTNDLAALRNGTYPNSKIIHDATGKGDYGYFHTFGGYFDPGKWTVCHSKYDESPGGSLYCYIHLNATKAAEKLTIGACVPASCSSDDLNTLPAATVATALHLPAEYAGGIIADCTQATYDIPWGTWIFVSVYIILIILVIIGTLIDAQLTHNIIPFLSKAPEGYAEIDGNYDDEKNSARNGDKEVKLEDKHNNLWIKLLLSFSFTYNYGRLVSPPPPGNFDSLNGVRVIAMMFVVIGHTFYFFWDTMAMLNFQTVGQTVKLFRFQIVVAGFYAVDTFFFLSGFLVAYLFVKELQGKGISGKMMFMFYFHRFYRLTPSLIMGMFFFYLITPYWSNGPYWQFYQDFVIDRCSTGWWYTLLYVQNFVDPSHLCMGWSWYLADDMQYYIISPIFLIAYWKNRALGWSLAIAGIAICLAANLGISVHHDLQEFFGFELDAERLDYVLPGGKFGTLIYLPPWTRIAPYLIGFLCAFILLERGTKFKVPAISRAVIYLTSFLILFILTFITWTDSNYGWLPWMNYLWITISRSMWSIGLGALLMLCVIGYGGIFSSLMSKSFWVPFARLSYGAYIFHLINLATIYNGYKQAITYTFSVVFYFFMGHLIISFLLAFANFFLVEKPLMNLETLLLRRQPRAKTQ